jgi:CTP synthase (UTP-ammonia lyase)
MEVFSRTSLLCRQPCLWRAIVSGEFHPRNAAAPSYGRKLLRIGRIGAESDHRHVYPAALAALGDAGDAEAIDIDVRLVPPLALRRQDVDAVLEDVDCLLLPGGSDMADVPGQILMAAGALRRQTPTIGLCLGMQTMTAAVAQRALGSEDANLAEADPSAPLKTFTPLSEEGSLPPHRLREKKVMVVTGSRLPDILGAEMSIRCNHRFRLNPELGPVLRGAGLVVSAHDVWPDRGCNQARGTSVLFRIAGTLSCRSDAPHPLIRAFVQACWQIVTGIASTHHPSA